jgi:hypothetical protein
MRARTSRWPPPRPRRTRRPDVTDEGDVVLQARDGRLRADVMAPRTASARSAPAQRPPAPNGCRKDVDVDLMYDSDAGSAPG